MQDVLSSFKEKNLSDKFLKALGVKKKAKN